MIDASLTAQLVLGEGTGRIAVSACPGTVGLHPQRRVLASARIDLQVLHTPLKRFELCAGLCLWQAPGAVRVGDVVVRRAERAGPGAGVRALELRHRVQAVFTIAASTS